MAKIHIRYRKDGTRGLYVGKRCLAFGSPETIYGIGQAIREKRKARKADRHVRSV